MLFTENLQRAINLSSRLHREQIRKDIHATPYASHLFSVMIILSSFTEDEDILIAGLMHDTLEDVPGYSYEKLTEDTNERVAEIVKGVTEELNPNLDPDMQLPWLMRKENYIKNLKEGSLESLYVSLADKTHNIMSILLAVKEENTDHLKKFHGSIKNMVWFFDEIEKVAEERLGKENALLINMSNKLQELKNHLN